MVLAKKTSLLFSHFIRSCKCKKKHTLYSAILKTFLLKFKKVNVNIYHCRFCNNYHIGHKTKREIKKWIEINKIPTITLLDCL